MLNPSSGSLLARPVLGVSSWGGWKRRRCRKQPPTAAAAAVEEIHRDPTGTFTLATPGHAVPARWRSRALGTVRRAPRVCRTVLKGDGDRAATLGTLASYWAENCRPPGRPQHCDYFGDDEDVDRRTKNQAEMRRRREAAVTASSAA